MYKHITSAFSGQPKVAHLFACAKNAPLLSAADAGVRCFKHPASNILFKMDVGDRDE